MGAIALEALAAVVLLSLAVSLAAQTSTAMSQQRKNFAGEQQRLDSQVNLMTYAVALPYSQVTEDRLQNYAYKVFPDSDRFAWDIQVDPTTRELDGETVAAKRVSIALVRLRPRKHTSPQDDSSPRTAATPSAPRRPLVGWRFPTRSTMEAKP